MRTLAALIAITVSIENAYAADAMFGVNSAFWSSANRVGQTDEELATLARHASMGWNRDGFTWHAIEKKKGVYDFSVTDQIIQRSEEAHMKVIGVLGFGNTLYGWKHVFDAPTTDAQVAAFGHFVEVTAARYRGRVQYWEIWNEPNTQAFFHTAQSSDAPIAYLKILKAAYEAVKKSDPNAQVIGGAIAGYPTGFIGNVFQLGGLNYMDAFSLHPYVYPKAPEAAKLPWVMDTFHSLMKKYKADKPIIVTEIGYPTNLGAKGVSEERQADLLTRTLGTLAASKVKLVTAFSLRDTRNVAVPQDAYNVERNFGILHNDLSPKPAYSALSNLNRHLNASLFEQRLPITSGDSTGVQALSFQMSDASKGRTLMLWSSDESVDANGTLLSEGRKTLNLELPSLQGVYVLNLTGQHIKVPTQGNTLQIEVGSSPLYVIGVPEGTLTLEVVGERHVSAQ